MVKNETGGCYRVPPSEVQHEFDNPDENTGMTRSGAQWSRIESHGGEDIPVYAQGPMVRFDYKYIF